ncbi:MAG: hypothetical protein GVY16_01915 [Planctomycetes bacterium]|nr:hypothetical protein [Phycisphaerae bacterium]NBB94477.1 hypothetical protein [Planctomycetota bacterium]
MLYRRYRTCLWLLPLVLVAGLFVGCLPVELSVSPSGEVLIPRAEGFVVYSPADGSVKVWNDAAGGQAAFAMYSPDGKSALAIVEASGGGMGKSFKVMLIGADGEATEICSRSNITYAQWSPDGMYATITRVADQQVEPVDQNLPEMILINVAEGTTKKLASNVAGIHRWMPDSKKLVVFQIERKSEDANQYAGKLMTLDVASGEMVALAGMMGEQDAFFDVSPDGKTAMVTALKVDAANAELPDEVDGKAKLYSLDMTSGASKEISDSAGFAMYSPKGTKMLIGASEEQDGAIALSVAAADGSGMKKVVDDAAKQTGGGMGNQATIYPTWMDDETVLYLSKHAVYGTAGANLVLTSVKADGSGRRNHQGTIDVGLQGK